MATPWPWKMEKCIDAFEGENMMNELLQF